MSRLVITVAALMCLAINGCGCRESRRPAPPILFARPLEAAFSEASRQPVVSGREFPVSGHLRLDDPTAPIGKLHVRLIRKNSNSEEIIYWSALATLKPQEGDKFRFECNLKAPAEAGDYLLRARYKRDNIAECDLSVQPAPSTDVQ